MILSVVEQTDGGVGHQKVNVYIFHCRNDPLDLFFFICKRKCIKKVLGQSGCKLEMKMPAFAKASAGAGGEGGIRTLDTGLSPYDGLANR